MEGFINAYPTWGLFKCQIHLRSRLQTVCLDYAKIPDVWRLLNSSSIYLIFSRLPGTKYRARPSHSSSIWSNKSCYQSHRTTQKWLTSRQYPAWIFFCKQPVTCYTHPDPHTWSTLPFAFVNNCSLFMSAKLCLLRPAEDKIRAMCDVSRGGQEEKKWRKYP